MSEVMLVCALAEHIPCAARTMDVIGVDRGALICLKQQLPMVKAIGDFDSVSEKEYDQICAAAEVVKLPAQKNETDTEQAILYALSCGYETIYLYGALGGRMDHELANLYLLMYRDWPLVLMNDTNRMRVLKKGSYRIKKEHAYLSFFPLEDCCISEEGVAYPLQKRWLNKTDIYATSNEILGEYAQITIHSGSVIMVEAEDASHKNKKG